MKKSEYRTTRAFANKAGNTAVAKQPTWKTIEDENVKHVWQCPNCSKLVEVDPTSYQEVGNPVCSSPCDTEMVYVHTEILI